MDHIEPIINEDLVNCWKCPNCVNKGYINSNFMKDLKLSQSDNSSGSSSLNENYTSIFDIASVSSTAPVQNQVTWPVDFALTAANSRKNFLEMALSNVPPLKPKRHRRTKQEMETIKLNLTNLKDNFDIKRDNQIDAFKIAQDDDESIISIDSLTYFEKQIILREFCEVVTKQNESKCDHLYKKKSTEKASKYTITKTSNGNSSDHDTIIVDTDDSDSKDFDLDEEGIKILNIKKNTNKISVKPKIQNDITNEFGSYRFDPRNEHIYHDDD